MKQILNAAGINFIRQWPEEDRRSSTPSGHWIVKFVFIVGSTTSCRRTGRASRR
jgi:hypothetical protein